MSKDHPLGIERQQADLNDLAQRLGWGEPVHYSENDMSAGKRKTRPVFDQLKADYESGKIDGILVCDLDRLTRRLPELVPFSEWVQEHHVPVETCEGDDFRTAGGLMVINMKGTVAEHESRRMSERTARALLQKVQNGEMPNGRARWGYNADMTINEPQAELLRGWVRHVLAGGRKADIVNELRSTGTPTMRGGKWSDSVVRAMLLSPVPAGYQDHTYSTPDGKVTERFKGNWEPIISLADHEAVSAAITGRKKPGTLAARNYLLSGIATCGRCGRPMRGALRANRKNYAPGRDWIYKCQWHGGGCYLSRTGWRVDLLIGFAVIETMAALQDRDGPVSEWDDGTEAVTSEPERQAESERLEQKITNLRAAYRRGDIEDTDYFATLRELRDDHTAAVRAEAREVAERAAEDARARYTDEDWNTSGLEAKRDMIRSLLDQIVIRQSKIRGGQQFDPTSVWFKPKGVDRFLTFRRRPVDAGRSDIGVEIIYAE
jgi:DNA invertase Pin-like site-specific DNA recombinase